MDVILPILSVMMLLGTGWLARKRGWITDLGTREISRVLISLIAPCMIFSALLRRDADSILDNAYLPLLSLGLIAIGLAVGGLVLRTLPGMPEPTRRGFLFQCGINNYLFLPLPLVQLRYGNEGVALLILAATGFDLSVWTIGVGIFSPGSRMRDRIRGVFTPTLFALVTSFLWILLRDRAPAVTRWAAHPPFLAANLGALFLSVCDFIGRATIPMSMLVAGSRIAALHPSHLADRRTILVSGLRLVVIPFLFLMALRFVPLQPTARGVLTIMALMPTAVTGVVLSDRYGGDTDFVTGGMLLTHLLAMVTIPLFLYLLP